MSDHTFAITHLVGTSPDGIDEAVRNGIRRAGETLRNLDWFEVTQIRGKIDNDKVGYYQVGLKLGFRHESR